MLQETFRPRLCILDVNLDNRNPVPMESDFNLSRTKNCAIWAGQAQVIRGCPLAAVLPVALALGCRFAMPFHLSLTHNQPEARECNLERPPSCARDAVGRNSHNVSLQQLGQGRSFDLQQLAPLSRLCVVSCSRRYAIH